MKGTWRKIRKKGRNKIKVKKDIGERRKRAEGALPDEERRKGREEIAKKEGWEKKREETGKKGR